mgnify:CR=1 FL=1
MINNLTTYVSTTFTADNSRLYDALNICHVNGIKSVEIGSNHAYEKNFNYLKKFKFNYLVHNYFPVPKNDFVINIASFNKQIRKMSIKHIKNAISFCENIDAKLYTFHPGFLTDPKGSNITNDNYDFLWDNNLLKVTNRSKAMELMYDSLDIIIEFAKSKNVSIAIETEGSFNRKEHLLMQEPSEFEEFLRKYTINDIGINLNIGHLNLASRAFNFKRRDFVDLISNYIVAMELSHNDRIEDEHLPLIDKEWYWDIINDKRFNHTYKILEFRNTSIEEILKTINILEKYKCLSNI